MAIAGPPAATEEEFVRLCRAMGPGEVARHLKINVRGVYKRIERMEARGFSFQYQRAKTPHRVTPVDANPARLNIDMDNGIVMIASDAHYVPGIITAAHKAFVKLCKELKPRVIVMNGDVFDGGAISRYPRIGWDKKPTVKEELQACQERLDEIQSAAPRAVRAWPLGNHDARLETRLAAEAPEFEGIKGFHLKDHFPDWKPCWSFWVNDTVAIKHRFKGGMHATHNNTLWAGKSIVTGHLHSLKVTPFSDYNGTRYGVDSGTLAEPYDEQFADYTELNPVNWRSGFVVLTFHKGRLLWPEVAYAGPDGVEYCGRILE